MKRKTRRPILFGVLLAISLLGSEIISGSSGNNLSRTSAGGLGRIHNVSGVACPAPFTDQAGVCVLSKDETITTAIIVPSNTQLNCQKFKLKAAKSGTGIDANARSQPEVAMVAVGMPNAPVEKVTIQNCSLVDFDFGILAMDAGKNEGEFTITNNIISARFVALDLFNVDRLQVSYNELSFKATGGRGIYLGHDSDSNAIFGNKISANLSVNVTQAVRVPGPVSSSNPAVDAGSGILITHVEGPEPTLVNAIVDGNLYQHWVSANDSSDGNSVADNHIVFPQDPKLAPNSTIDGIVMAGANYSNFVRGNTVRRARASIRAGLQTGTRDFVGTCSLDQSPKRRRCLANSDCMISNIDTVSKGTCNKPAAVTVRWISSDDNIYRNTILGPFATGITVAGQNTKIYDNLIIGPFRSDAGGGVAAGIMLLGKYPLQSNTVVIQNIIANVPAALGLQKIFPQPGVPPEVPTAFTAQIYQNDFVGYVTAVRTSNDYDLITNLWRTLTDQQGMPVHQGNYWGMPCTMNGFNRSSVVRIDGLVNLLAEIKDAHPFEEPIAKAPDWLNSFPPTWGYPRPCF